MPNAYDGDAESFRVDPEKIAEAIALNREIERLKKANFELRNRLKKNTNGHFGGRGGLEENATVEIIKGSSISPVDVEWLWNGWLARGKLQIIAGAKGTLKTSIAIDLAARITAGGKWPDGTMAPLGDVLIWSGEDDFDDTILPRFLAAGGEAGQLHYVKDTFVDGKRRPFDPAHDVDKLMEAVKAIPSLQLVIIDSIVSAVAGDSHKNAEVRRGLAPLIYYSAENRCCILGLTHFTKGTVGKDPVERVTASLAFGAVPRIVLVTAKPISADLKCRLVRAASNIGPHGGGFEYAPYQELLTGYDFAAQRVSWGARLEGTALDLLNDVEQPKSNEAPEPPRSAAAEFLKALLAVGPVPVINIREEADAAGLAWGTIRRAQDSLRITSEKDGFSGGWSWRLPNDVPPGEGTEI